MSLQPIGEVVKTRFESDLSFVAWEVGDFVDYLCGESG